MFGFFLLLLTLPLVYTAPTNYTDNFGRKVAYPLAVAADDPEGPNNCLTANFGLQFSEIVTYTVDCDILKWGNLDICFAYKAFWKDSSTIVFGFRGSQGHQVDEETNATQTISQLETDFGKVNYYFYTAFSRLLVNMSADIDAAVADGRIQKFLFVGHSLGGSLASIFAAYMSKSRGVAAARLQVVTFGMPRTGDSTFAEYIENNVGTRYRVVANYDLVPHTPLSIMHVNNSDDYYQHFGQEIYYNSTMETASFKACTLTNEDGTCSNSQTSDLNAMEHVYYYNIRQDFFIENQCLYPPPAKCPSYYVAVGTTLPTYCIRAFYGKGKKTWAEAESICEQENHAQPLTFLAGIDTIYRNNYVLNIAHANSTSSSCDRYFIGLYQNPTHEKWEWKDTTVPYLYQNWGELFSDIQQNKIAYMDDTQNSGKWFYGDGNTEECFVCGTTACSCPSGSGKWIQSSVDPCKCYSYVNVTTDWNSANEQCMAKDFRASLVSIDSAFFNNEIQNNPNKPTTCSQYFIGLERESTDFEWINGDTSGYRNWAPGFPTGTANCGQMNSTTGKWTNVDCAASTGCYICGL